jgi:hypoxanthine phosphoribosyltransferase
MRTVFTEDEIRGVVRRLAAEIDRDYAGREVTLIGVLSGAFIFLADLIRCLQKTDCRVEFVRLSSYGAQTSSSGHVERLLGCRSSLQDRHVLVVEEIVDTGLTLQQLLEDLAAQNPASIAVCTLLDKRAHRQTQVRVDYSGVVVEDGFLVGYGLDYAERYRNLPDIRVMESPSPVTAQP